MYSVLILQLCAHSLFFQWVLGCSHATKGLDKFLRTVPSASKHKVPVSVKNKHRVMYVISIFDIEFPLKVIIFHAFY